MEEYFHIYNRGAHKALIFNDQSDYWRFLYSLYLSNSNIPFVFAEISERNIFALDRGQVLVDIIAYCLMPNHYHIYVKENEPGNITKFIRRLSTAYTMYYNKKYDHSGTIFQGRYKAKPVVDEIYSATLINYIHLNPFGIEVPDLSKDGKADYAKEAYDYSRKYDYSSLKDYLGEIRPQKAIIGRFNLPEVEPPTSPVSQ